MMKKSNVITLCGSTRFKDVFMSVQKQLTLKGNIVLSPCVFEHCDDIISNEERNTLVNLHKCMIDMSNEIYVINVNGYIGSSTKSEIEYARENGKKIRYYINPIENVERLTKREILMKELKEKLKAYYNTRGFCYCSGILNGLALMNDITQEESIELYSFIKSLMGENNELSLVTRFGNILATKEQAKELVEVIKLASSWEGAFGSTKRQLELIDTSKKIIREITDR